MKNDRQRCKIKVRKFLFNILWRFGVIEENPGVGANSASPGPDRVKITANSPQRSSLSHVFIP